MEDFPLNRNPGEAEVSLMGEDRAWDTFCLFLFFVFYTVVSQQSIQKQLAVLILPKWKLYMGVALSFLWQPKHFYFQNQKSLGFFSFGAAFR